MLRRPVTCATSAHHSQNGGIKIARHARRALFGFFCGALAPAAFAFETTACLSPAKNMALLEGALTQDGWAVVDGPSAPVIDALAWMGMPQYFAGDSGGSSKTDILALKQKSAKGYFRKKDLPNAKTRILKRNIGVDPDFLLVTWLKTSSEQINIICNFALSESTTTEIRAQQALPTYNKSGLSRLPTQHRVLNGRSGSVQVVFLDRTSLEKQLNSPVAAAAIVSTSLSYNAKDITP